MINSPESKSSDEKLLAMVSMMAADIEMLKEEFSDLRATVEQMNGGK